LGEFFVRNFSIAVSIDLLDDLLDHSFIKVLTEGENFLDLSNRDGTATIFIEHLEGSLELIVTQQVLFVQSGNNEFRVLNFT
jgi:hypothetical protein